MRSAKTASKTKAGSRAMKASPSIKNSSPRRGKTRAGRSTSTKVMGVRVPKTLIRTLWILSSIRHAVAKFLLVLLSRRRLPRLPLS
jgi:hypothetical protein